MRSNYERNKIRARVREQAKRRPAGVARHDILISTHGCLWGADNLSALLQRRGMSAAVVRKPHQCDLKIMLGWYSNNNSEENHWAEMKMARRKVIWWVGTDLMWLEAALGGAGQSLKDHPRIKKLNNEGVEHWAEWGPSAERLRACGIENVRIVHLPTRKRYEPMPLPEKFTVGIYCYDSRSGFYGEEIVKRAAALSPETRWMIYPRRRAESRGNIDYVARVDAEDVDKLYARQSLHVRCVMSDGMPQGPMEACMAGRPVIYNFAPLPYVEHMPDMTPQKLARMVERVRQNQRRGAAYNRKGSEYWRERNDPEKLIAEIERIMK